MKSEIKSRLPANPSKRRIVGFSLPPNIAVDVKAEAAKRQLSLTALFQEMWSDYLAKTKKGRR